MRRFRNLLIVALAAASTACLYERQAVRDEPQVEAPPPPPTSDAQPDSSYQTQGAQPPPAGTEVDEETFYSGLSPYGSWTVVAPYGRVWVPAVGYGWRPYYYGRWVLTDWGWTFASDDPWGWAAYHYGRWNWGVGYGWYWVPGRIWGPAWVSWRYGGGYAAWCPLGPSGVIFGYNHPAWVAVQEQHFTRPIARVAVPVRSTARVVGLAQPLAGPHATPIARSGSFGPPVASVQRAVGQPIARVPASQVTARPQPNASAGSSSGGPSSGPTRSPMSPRARTGAGGDAPHSAEPARPAPRPYTGAPRSGGQGTPRARGNYGGGNYGGGGARSGGGAPRGGGGAPRGGGGGNPGGASSGGAHAPAAPSAPRSGGPHASGKTK